MIRESASKDYASVDRIPSPSRSASPPQLIPRFQSFYPSACLLDSLPTLIDFIFLSFMVYVDLETVISSPRCCENRRLIKFRVGLVSVECIYLYHERHSFASSDG